MKKTGFARHLSGLLALLVCLFMVASAGACGPAMIGGKPSSPNAPQSQATSTAAAEVPGRVAIFTPSDGITLSQHTPINKWAALVPELKAALTKEHLSGKRIDAYTSGNLEDQSKELQDYVVNRLSERKAGKTAEPTTLVVAPMTSPDSITRQYGDYISKSLDTDARDKASARLVSSLRLAAGAGMHLVLLANQVPGIQPDLFVQLSDARAIGQMQADKLASKLELDKASKNNPCRIEILLPNRTAETSSSDASSADKDAEASQAQQGRQEEQDAQSSFPAQAFAGIWQVLGPYFRDGRAVSPSGRLQADSTEKDWQTVTFDPGKDAAATGKELATRLAMSDGTKTRTEVDGILAMNDFIVSGVVSELGDLGYRGTSADVNPEISISGIVGSMAGRQDLHRQRVPKPAQDPATRNQTGSDADSSQQTTGKTQETTPSDDHAAWPIISGYGAYVDNIPQIVDGRQWMTGLEDRLGLAADIAKACIGLNSQGKVPAMNTIQAINQNGKQVRRLSRPLVAVSASNLKATLIDTGYIKPADAGL
ncbi:hypothetical protein J3T91_02610 [Bifidobacterium sp. B4001]|uniref:hypothetical protein n=1 Tax=unclassified Bifidobacterium TaxID=2608897 RepID=UPI00226B397A|nr:MULTISPECIES: hypothetical protein [unclassified Bifidobacterium]MCX8672411.1 hypothetical protein [Bifidobacterium sp. B4079]MCX8680845.1 hypothetical protein [Bifidobacterium sp. B4001]